MKPSKPREIVETFSQTSGKMYFDSVLQKTAFDHFTTGKVDKDVTVKRFIETSALKERDDLIKELVSFLNSLELSAYKCLDVDDDEEPIGIDPETIYANVGALLAKAREKMKGWEK